jgi:hypothetical protein
MADAPARRHRTLSQALGELVRAGQERRQFDPSLDAEIAGAMIATYFFRICVLESVCKPEETLCWEDRMGSALDVLYQGLKP